MTTKSIVQTTIMCDGCKNEIKSPDLLQYFCLQVKPKNLLKYPEIVEDRDFCGIGCLKKWLIVKNND